jgi:hypothetical protein
MANANAPRGLIPVGTLNHGAYRGKIRTFLATGATGAIYIGSPVTVGNTSGMFNGQRYTTVAGGFTTAGIVQGVCVAVLRTDRTSTTNRATSTDRMILVDVDPYTIYEVQDNQATDAAALLGTEVDMVADLSSDAGSTVTGYSSIAVDGSTATATYSDHDVEILDIVQSPDNVLGAYAKYHVRLLRHPALGTIDALAGN